MKIKFPLCFRPLALETDDINTNDCLSDQDYLLSRSNKGSSRKFCRDSKSLHQQKQRGSDKNAYPLIPRSKSHQDSLKTSKSLVSLQSVDDNSTSSLHSDTKHSRSSSFNKSLSRSRSRSKSLDDQKQKFSEAKQKSWNSVSYVFTMSLCVTVFCGKAYAILLTSIILFYLISRRTCIGKSSKSVPKFPDMRKDYKKRVIMEGLLKRNHLHGSRSERG